MFLKEVLPEFLYNFFQIQGFLQRFFFLEFYRNSSNFFWCFRGNPSGTPKCIHVLFAVHITAGFCFDICAAVVPSRTLFLNTSKRFHWILSSVVFEISTRFLPGFPPKVPSGNPSGLNSGNLSTFSSANPLEVPSGSPTSIPHRNLSEVVFGNPPSFGNLPAVPGKISTLNFWT